MRGSTEFRDALAALRREVEAARRLTDAQRECEDAIRRALPAAELESRLSLQATALEAMRVAGLERARFLAGPEAVTNWLAGPATPDRELLRASVVEARRLREEIRSRARRVAYLARRSAEWCGARRSDLASLAVRAASAEGGYGALGAIPSERRFAWKIDRAA